MNYYSLIVCGGLTAEQIKVVRTLVKELNNNGYCVRLGGDELSSKIVFESGVREEVSHEFYLPWAGFDLESNGVVVNVSRDIKHMKVARDNSPNWNKISMGAKCMLVRNVMQLLGPNLDNPSDCLLVSGYGGMSLGTNTSALRIAENNAIPVIDLGIINEDNYNKILTSIMSKGKSKEIRDERFISIG